MKAKGLITIVVLLTILVGGGTSAYFWQQNKAYANVFDGNGYVHVADPETDVKQVAFSEGTSWKKGLSDTVTFEDSQGNEQTVSTESFVHYDDQSLTAMSAGVVADLNDLENAQITNHYAISPKVSLERSGSGYEISSSNVNVGFLDFLWKISDKKYMLVSDHIQLHFSEDDIRDVEGYVEITYIDEGVLQLQTKENVWQTISQSCYATLNNGEKIDLVQKNVQNRDGEVLTDFSKLVLDSEDNVEVTPLTQDLIDVKETVIPHFDITAEQGKDGAQGAAGENGSNGEAGKAGEAGANGAAGTSGTNGAAGDPGPKGPDGPDGENPDFIQTEVLSLPEFIIEGWNPTSTGCKGTIKVSDPKNMLRDAVNGKTSKVYVVDSLTGQEVVVAIYEHDNTGRFTFENVNSEGYPFSISGLLPDREYVLMVDAPIEVSQDKAYVRTFITKTFYTDSIGVYLEKGNSKKEIVALKACAQSYVKGIEKATVYLYSSQAAAAAATADAPGSPYTINGYIRSFEINKSNYTEENYLGKKPIECEFNNNDPTSSRPGTTLPADSDIRISSNTTYYARIVANIAESAEEGSNNQNTTYKNVMPAQILEVTTLKEAATVGAPMLTPNRTNWGFDVMPGILKDQDSGIINYRYEFVNAGDVNDIDDPVDRSKIVKTIETTSAKTVLVPIDYNPSDSGNTSGNRYGLGTGEKYRVRLVVTFNDNEKTYEITSSWSEPAAVEGSQLPIVRFVNASGEGNTGTGESSGATGTSNWYDQIYGTVRVIPGTQGSKLMLDKNNPPKVTIRASGYYYVQYPVYTSEDARDLQLAAGSYLTGTVDQATGEVIINIDQKAIDKLKNPGGTVSGAGTVNGLRADTSYRIIVEGALTDNGTTVKEESAVIGSCVVKTPDIQSVSVSLSYDSTSDDNRTLRNSRLTLFRDNQGEVLDWQQQTLTSVTIEALDTLSSSKPVSTVTLTQQNYATVLNMANNDKALGTVLKEGIAIDQTLLQKGNPAFSTQSRSNIFIRVTGVMDYTGLSDNQQNQNAYVPEDANNPGDNKDDHSKYYTNQFTLLDTGDTWGDNDKNAAAIGAPESMTLTYEIPLTSSADPIPDPEKGVSVVRYDDDKDGNADERYLLTANYANGAKLARWVTFYVFDDPDFHEKSYAASAGYSVDTSAFPAGSGVTQLTPVTAVDGQKKGTWLAKIRVPVLTTGTYANQIPKIEFIPQTAKSYYGSDEGALREYNSYLDALARGDKNATMGNNTWKLFYPSGSTEEATGHQFVFAWTLEYQKDDGQRTICYYPFSESSYQEFTSIPHSKSVSAPRHKPVIYAKPWDSMPVKNDSEYTADKMSYVEWMMYVSDPQKSVVEATGSGITQRSAQLYQLNGTDVGYDLWDAGGTSIVSLNMKEPVLEEYTTGEIVRIGLTGSGSSSSETADIGMRVQYYNDKYTINGEGYGLFEKNAEGRPNDYSERTKTNAKNDNLDFSVEKYIKAFRYNLLDYSLNSSTLQNIANNVKVDISLPEGDVINQLNVKVTGSRSYMELINGIRLTFKQGNKTITLDKYVETTIDKISEKKWIETGAADNSLIFNFRVSIPRELGSIAGNTADIQAEFIYETGHEGYKYLTDYNGKMQPVSLVQYTDSSMTSDESVHLVFRQEGSIINRGIADPEAPKAGSFFMGRLFTTKDNIRWYSGDWHTTMEFKSTRTELWSSNSWSTEVITVDYRNGEGASGLVPRQITTKEINGANLTMNGSAITQIDIPATVPVIHFVNASGFSNYITTDFTVQGQLENPEIFFTLEKLVKDGDKNVHKLQQAAIDRNGAFTWSDVSVREGVENSEYVHDLLIDASTSMSNRILFKNVPSSYGDGYNGSHSFTNLAKETTYFIRAYYRDSQGRFSLLNMLDISNGELKANEREISTVGSPAVTFNAGYRPENSYDKKWLWTDVKVSNLSSYYYTVELQDKNGEFITYVDVDSNLSGGRAYNKKNAFDVGLLDTEGTYLNYNIIGRVVKYDRTLGRNNFNIQTSGEESTYPVLDTSKGTGNVYLSYGETYNMKLRLYAIGSGPAYVDGYDINSDVENLLNNSGNQYVNDFIVDADDDIITLRGSYDINEDDKPIVNFNMYYTINSGRMRHGYAVASIIRVHQEADGSFSYEDVTDKAEMTSQGANGQFGNARPATEAFKPGRRNFTLDVSSYPAGDKFICYIYSILDDVDSTNTGGVENAPSRDQILAGRKTTPYNMDTERIAIVENGVITGASKRMAYSTVNYTGAQTSAGKILIEAEKQSVVATMTDPVNLKDITTATWSIDASYMVPDQSGEQRVVSTRVDQPILIESSGSTHKFKLMPDFVLPSNAYDVIYTVTLQLNGGTVAMTSVSESWHVGYNNGIYTLSGVLEL